MYVLLLSFAYTDDLDFPQPNSEAGEENRIVIVAKKIYPLKLSSISNNIFSLLY